MKIFCIVILASNFVRTNSMVDEFMSCDRLFGGSGEEAKARSARHLLEAIPCDMKKQSFCSNKGSAYPEAAIWRFKEENRALMRRLYGDMESTTLYREMRSTAEKSSNNFQSSQNPHSRKSHMATKSKQSRSSPMLLPHIARSPAGGTSLFSTLDYNIRIGSGLATVQSAKVPVMNSRLATRIGGGRLKIKKKIMKKKKNPNNGLGMNNSSILEENPQHHLIIKSKSSTSTSGPVESPPVALPLKLVAANKNSESNTEQQITTTIRVSTTSTVSSVSVKASTSEDSTIQPTTLSPSTVDGDMTETTMIYPTTTIGNENVYTTDTIPMIFDPTTIDGSATSQVYTDVDSSTSGGISDDETTQQNQEPTIDSDNDNSELDQSITTVCKILENMLDNAGMGNCQEILKMMAQTPSEETTPPETSTEEEKEEEIAYIDDSIYSGSSTSACPVRREVVSPYWANNTRKQTLALLNIYPFEQYVHMEMCKFEHHEMLCRPGCKCEQQYRMHRLLAFDPSNECRGIFSDWFELPSFCVCKCYESVTDNFIPRPRKPRIDLDTETQSEFDGNAEGRSRTQKTLQENQDSHQPIPKAKKRFGEQRGFQNIPAILPYEAKLALLKEIRHRDNRNLLKSLKVLKSAIGKSNITENRNSENMNSNSGNDNKSDEQASVYAEISEENTYKKLDNTKIGIGSMNNNKEEASNQEEQNNDHFLYNIRYGNLPVMEFKLPDGSSGTVDKVPRR